MKIMQIPEDERPREKALKYGIGSLSNHELLAIIIKNGTKEFSALDIAQKILSEYENLDNLFNINIEQLMKVKGLKLAKSVEIIAIGELLKRILSTKLYMQKKINNPEEIAQYFEPILRNEKQELFLVVFLDVRNNIIKYETLFSGGINFSLIDVNIVFKKALLLSASKIICLHNHPSGEVTPSQSDIQISKKIDQVGKLLEIILLDHIIVGKGKYASLKQMSYF